ncbi:MAG: hypothetical protein AAFO88_08430 [Pseudomonadota bacterium]
MSYWNKLAGLALVGALVSAPALADGRERTVVQGPAPLQAHSQLICEHGRYADGRCAPAQTRIVRHAPTTTRRIVRTEAQPRAAAPRYDFSSFTGGVGADISTNLVYGGGGIVVVGTSGRRSFSGVPGRARILSRVTRRGGACCH